MGQKFLKIYKKADIKEVKEHLLIYGDLAGNCANCQAMDLKVDTVQCPQCQTSFKYIAFRNIKHHLPKMQKLSEERTDLTFVDHDDFSRNLGALKAEEFLK